MKDIGGLIWIILVVIGVISSIVKNAKKAAAQRDAARPRMAPAPQPGPAPQTIVQQMAILPPVVAPTPPPVRCVKPPQPTAMPVHLPFEKVASTGTSSPIRGMFGSKASLVRAIVAAEVLGQPKCLQEQSIWSPRHSEPSI